MTLGVLLNVGGRYVAMAACLVYDNRTLSHLVRFRWVLALALIFVYFATKCSYPLEPGEQFYDPPYDLPKE